MTPTLPTMSRDADWGFRIARTRQEAGIAHLELEKSKPPIKHLSIPLSVIFEFNLGFWLLFGPFLAIATGYWR